jgi:ribosomal protein S27AE
MTDKKKPAYQRWKLYEVKDGQLIRKNPRSPKDNGLFMAIHKDRKHCGVTGHTESNTQKQEEKLSEKPKEQTSK